MIPAGAQNSQSPDAWGYAESGLGCSFCALGQADQTQGDLVLYGRPVEAGLYFYTIPLAVPVSDEAKIMQLTQELANAKIPQGEGVFIGSFVSHQTKNALTKDQILQALESPNPNELMLALPMPEMIFQTATRTLVALGVWVWVSERQEDHGLAQPITTHFSSDGRVVSEVGADGRSWQPSLSGVFWGVVAIVVALAVILAILDRWLGYRNQSANGEQIAPKTNKNKGFLDSLITPIQEGVTSLFLWGVGIFFGGALLFEIGKRVTSRAIK